VTLPLFRRTRVLTRAAANGDKFFGGVPFGSEPFPITPAPDRRLDLDGMDEAARRRAAVIRGRKQLQNARGL
jgi:hypothetical protein